jgi:hypothetical protein
MGSGGIAPRILNLLLEMRVQLHAPAASPPETEPSIPIVQEAGWSQEPFRT